MKLKRKSSLQKTLDRIPDKLEPVYRQVEAHEFVKVYMTATTIEEVATKLGISKQSVYTRSGTLRKRGVHLPVKERPQVDPNTPEELNKLIARLERKSK